MAIREQPDRLMISLAPNADVHALLTTGPLAGMTMERSIAAGISMLRGCLGEGPLSGEAQWMSPVFQGVDSGRWLAPTNEVIVALKAGVSAESFFAGDSRFENFRPLTGTPDQFLATVAGGSGLTALTIANALQTDSRVQWSSPDMFQDWQRYAIPNDPLFTSQWHLHNTGQNGSMPDADVDAPEAWNISPGGSSSLTIAILDDGIEITHPDLAANIFVNPGEIAGNGADDDGNGWIDDVHGWDFTGNDPDPGPSSSADRHGTSTAGIAAGVGNNGLGLAGMAYKSRILPARIFNGPSATTDSNIASALYYASGRTANGAGTWNAAAITSNSWGGGSSSAVINSALTWATQSARGGLGVVNFFASGNESSTAVTQPAVQSATNPGVVAVGASTDLNVRASYSNYGTGLDVIAPSSGPSFGGRYGTVTTDRAGVNGYNESSGTAGDYTNTAASAFGGTSSATPLAAGIGALILAVDPALTAVQVRGLLRNTTDLINAGEGAYAAATGYSAPNGFGKVNAFTALSGIGTAEIQVFNGSTDVANGSTVSFAGGQTITLRIRNQGTLPLTLESLSLPAGPFEIVSAFGSASLAVGESTTCRVRYNPAGSGTTSSILTFSSNDSDEGSFSIVLQGGPVGANSFGYLYAPALFDAALNIQPGGNGVQTLTGLGSVDDAAQELDLGTNRFNYYGTAYSRLFVSSNGLLSFGEANSDFENGNLSGRPADPVAAVLWDDLRTNRNTATNDLVLYQFQDTTADGTPDQLVINWRNVHYLNSPVGDDGITFQAVLQLNTGSAAGAILFNYVDLDDGSGPGGSQGANLGGSATVGIKNAGTTAAASDAVLLMSGDVSPYVGDGRAVRIFRNSRPTANANGPYDVAPGGTVALSSAGSTDPDLPNDTLTFQWDLDGDGAFGESGTAAQRGDESGASPTFHAVGLTAGPYSISLRVSDSVGSAATASAIVNVTDGSGPSVSQFVIGDETAQRAMVRQLRVVFDRIIGYAGDPASAFELIGPGGAGVALNVSTTITNYRTEAVLTFLSSATAGSLNDGRYSLVVRGDQVRGTDSTPMTGNAAVSFHRFFGDWSGDARIDIADFGAFSLTYQLNVGQAGYLSAFDFNGDNRIDIADFGHFSLRYFTSLP